MKSPRSYLSAAFAPNNRWGLFFPFNVVLLSFLALFATAAVRAQSVSVDDAPGSVSIGTTIHPMATANEGDAPLTCVILSYSWDNSNWSELGANPNPSNPTDSEGNPITLDQAGTFYLKAEAWDANGNYVVSTASVDVIGNPCSVSVDNAPGSVSIGTSIHPMASASAGSYPLTCVILSYSWDNSNWSELGANPNPSNPNDSEGNPITLDQAGTFYLKAEAWDSGGNYAVSTSSVDVMGNPCTVSVGGAPGSATAGTTIYPSANASAGSYRLTQVILSYSWDNSNWTELGASPNPSNPNDSEGNPITLDQGGTFYLKAEAWDSGGNYASDTASVSVSADYGPSITSQPSSVTVNQGSTAYFSVSADGSPSPDYQWYKNGSALSNGGNISGAYSSTLTISNAQPGDAATYSCTASNSQGNATSNGATLTVRIPPVITSQPSNVSVNVGSSASFMVGASGSPSPTYQWRFNGTNITGATSSTYTIASCQTSNAGSYSVVVSNAAGSVTSNSATLTITTTPPPTISSGTASGVTSTSFSYQISATGATSYGATGLPNGLSVNSANGVISGIPTVAGTFAVGITASNSGGTGSGTLALSITFSAGDLTTYSFQYDKTNQLKQGPGGKYSPDAEGNIGSVTQ